MAAIPSLPPPPFLAHGAQKRRHHCGENPRSPPIRPMTAGRPQPRVYRCRHRIWLGVTGESAAGMPAKKYIYDTTSRTNESALFTVAQCALKSAGAGR